MAYQPHRRHRGAGVTALFASVLFPVPARAITTKPQPRSPRPERAGDACRIRRGDENFGSREQVAENEARIAELESAAQSAPAAPCASSTSTTGSNTLMSFVLNTKSMDSSSRYEYLEQVMDAASVPSPSERAQTELEARRPSSRAPGQAGGTIPPPRPPQARAREAAQAQADAEAEAELTALQQASQNMGGGAVATPNNGVVNWDVDQASFVAEWAPRIDAYLAGSPLEGQGATFANAAWKYGVDPRFSPAISNTESSKGRHCFRPHNAWGWGNASWGSWEEAIDAHVSGLARGYG
ncbi:MAG: hypothetical protein ACLVKA_10885, partial [Collinsella aerofaciens]